MGVTDKTEIVYEFEGYSVFVTQRRVFKGSEELDLTDAPVRVLIYLIEHRQGVVPYRELYEHMWGKGDVAPNNMSMHVSALRKAMGQHLIKTLSRKGFQFTARVTQRPGSLLVPVEPSFTLERGVAAFIDQAVSLQDIVVQIDRHRLVHLTGPFGVGKSRVANEIGLRLRERYRDGVFRIDLAAVRDEAAVVPRTLKELAVNPPLRGETADEVIARRYGDLPLLMIYDNCDRVLAPVTEFADELLRRLPNLAVLVTSREKMPGPTQAVYPVKPLSMPPAGAVSIAESGSGALLAEYRRVTGDKFDLTPKQAAEAVKLCRALDGIPLLLELAAGKISQFRLQGLNALLDRRLDTLDNGSSKADARHFSPRRALDWGFDGLAADERRFFARLAVFPGSFSFEAALAVAGVDEAGDSGNIRMFLHLVESSWVGTEDGHEDGPPRHRLLGTIKLYAEEKLRVSEETGKIDERHVQHYMALFEKAERERETRPGDEWLAEYGPEIDNVRKVLKHLIDDVKRVNDAMAFAGNVGRLFERLNLQAEGRSYLDPLVALIDKDTPPALAARLLRYAGVLWRFENRRAARALLERSADLYRALGAAYLLDLGAVLGVLGGEYLFLDQLDKAEATFAEAGEILTGSDRKLSLMNVLNGRGYLNVRKGEADEATRYLMQAREMAYALKDVLRESIILINLGELAFRIGSTGRALEQSDEAEKGFRSIGNQAQLGMVLVNRALYFAHSGDHVQASACATEALPLVRGNPHWLRLCSLALAWLAAHDGKYSKAAQILGFTKAGAARSGEVLRFTERSVHDPLETLLATKLTALDIRLAEQESALWTEDRAVEFLMKHVLSPKSVEI